MKEQKDTPYCHLFGTDSAKYVYDLGSNELLAVAPELAAVLERWGRVPEWEIIHNLKDDFLLSKIKGACATIRSARVEEGLFLALQPLLATPNPRLSEPGVCDSRLGHLILSVTEQCNLRCGYCLHGAGLGWVRGHGSRTMNFGAARKAVEYFLARSDPDRAPVISFYGGEPLLEIALIEKVTAFARKHARGQEICFALDTNGVLLDDKALDLVVREKMFLQVSLDGPRDIHDRCRRTGGGSPTFDQVMANLDRLLDRDPTSASRLSFIATLAPPVDLKSVAEFFAEFPPFAGHGIDIQPNVRVNFANLRGQDWPVTGDEWPSVTSQLEDAEQVYLDGIANLCRDQLSPVIRALFEPDLIRFHHRHRGPMADRFTPGGNCRPGRRKLHVTVDGRLQPCERTGNSLELGDLETGILPSAVRGLQEGFHEAVKDRCGSCFALRMCGVCYAAQAEFSNTDTGDFPVPEEVCESIRRRLDRTLRMMVRILEMEPQARAFLDDTVLV